MPGHGGVTSVRSGQQWFLKSPFYSHKDDLLGNNSRGLDSRVVPWTVLGPQVPRSQPSLSSLEEAASVS